MYWRAVQWLARSDDPEAAHELVLKWMKWAQKHRFILAMIRVICWTPKRRLRQKLLSGLRFDSPVLMAAGFDKNCAVPLVIEALGFGGAEYGTVTVPEQEGYDRQRIFRDPETRSLINRMGFPNIGSQKVKDKGWPYSNKSKPRGVNIGKGMDTPQDQAAGDYEQLVEILWKMFNFFVINVSSPNTPGIRDLDLEEIVRRVCDVFDRLSLLRIRLLVKVSPDMSAEQRREVVRIIIKYGLGGVVATNTTVQRPVKSPINDRPGGLSGDPLYELSIAAVKDFNRLLPKDKLVIAVGGITTTARAFEMLRYADLVEVYTGFVYGGPFFAAHLARYINRRLRQRGHKHISEYTRQGAMQPLKQSLSVFHRSRKEQ